VVGYFGADGLPRTLERIPLESFAAGIRALAARPDVDGERIAAMAISTGSEGLLGAAAHFADLLLRGLVAVSPSHVMWQAIGDQGAAPDTPSWTLGGRDLPFAPVAGEAVLPEMLRNAALRGWDRRRHHPTLMHLRSTYALDDEAALAGARIPVEQIAAPLLLLWGQDDALWPSGPMAAAIRDRRNNAADGAVLYPGAGHFFRTPRLPTTATWADEIAFGGEPAATARAHADAWARTIEFLHTTLE
jgi:dienelactone hydrolase